MKQTFAVNSTGNQKAIDRLLRREWLGYANLHRLRFLPDENPRLNRLELGKCGVIGHILGPTAEMLKKMNPPTHAGWFTLKLDDDGEVSDELEKSPLFSTAYFIPESVVPEELKELRQELTLDEVSADAELLVSRVGSDFTV